MSSKNIIPVKTLKMTIKFKIILIFLYLILPPKNILILKWVGGYNRNRGCDYSSFTTTKNYQIKLQLPTKITVTAIAVSEVSQAIHRSPKPCNPWREDHLHHLMMISSSSYPSSSSSSSYPMTQRLPSSSVNITRISDGYRTSKGRRSIFFKVFL